MRNFLRIQDTHKPIRLDQIPWLDYAVFFETVKNEIAEEGNHCLHYFGFQEDELFRFVCLLAEDHSHTIKVLGHRDAGPLQALTSVFPAFHVFEREIHEKLGIEFTDHPWLKPLRFLDKDGAKADMDAYPFYHLDSHELHQVGVGPVHAGVIEPGHFRFICRGEKVLHLEIHLGYQHRGVETLFTSTDSQLRQACLAENIAGDTAIGHSMAHAAAIEALAGKEIPTSLGIERAIALELERIAIHIGDTAALCTDVAYQLGQVVNESLRTLIINTTQLWCGNRFGKGLVRPGGSHYPLTESLALEIKKNLATVLDRYLQMSDRIFSMPSVLGRYEGIGTLTLQQSRLIGAVGMAARTTGLMRDIRFSHPDKIYKDLLFYPVTLESGDVMARAWLRRKEIEASSQIILDLLARYDFNKKHHYPPAYQFAWQPGMLSIGLAEGWRGEIVHVAVTGADGRLSTYKVKDPSVHNWMALALAVRNQEISDFPVCNKSFNLSYCGHDL